MRQESLRECSYPVPWGYGVIEDAFQQRTKREFSVVAIGEKDHAVAVPGEADDGVLCAVSVTFLEEGRAILRLRQQARLSAFLQDIKA